MAEHTFLRQERTRLKKVTEQVKLSQTAGLYPQSFAMPIGVQFELTGICNLNCKHCYNRSGDGDIQSRMKPNDWLALSKDIVDAGGVFQCILSGGEPLLLGQSLIEIMDVLDADHTGFILISNGLLMTEEWVKKLKRFSYYWLQISIDDSNEDAHDDFRGLAGSWKAAINAAFLLSSAGLPLVIAHTVTTENLHRLPQMVNLAYQLGASNLLCGEVLISGRAAENEYLWLDEKQRGHFYDQMIALREQYVGKMNIQYALPEGLELKTRKDVPNRSVIIRPNGDVRMDCTVPFTIGNVLNKPFDQIWREGGIDCWTHDEVQEYIQLLEPGKRNSIMVNHVSQDRCLFE